MEEPGGNLEGRLRRKRSHVVPKGEREGLRYLDPSRALGEKLGNECTHIGEVPKSTHPGGIITA